ncbi:Stk1 family PASTA domain-containing Ser/Thr kinase [Halalkalibacter urbisdiaboli]|uniref:Stk1 family PASTA domain-containing Ser/Thr kinase n=1 Tax=Halalkalibacter urbisdiaboli TaxID=1960589 RepID=UPI000B44229C|nr:Stk1 family PASTA domain-containing Ser/Thr kinase [Halalkalibacter urbisdiaboli]
MIGERISGRYQILETIGGGGMANVYKALDVILDRHVAVKVLQPQFSDDEQFIKRFRREAQAATSLAHPNVVSIYDVGEEGNIYYIVMEYVRGQTLKEMIQKNGPLPVEQALNFFEQMMSALSHAHANQIVHRDIKPHNILVSEEGVVKVTDFGIARAMSSATITHTNSVMGSVHYLSPEQARGGHVTNKSDIYSLGIVLYEMVTGTLPFSGDTAVSIAIKHLQNEIPSAKAIVPALPQSVENIIRKATVKDPLKRYESIHEMEEDVETALEPRRIHEKPFVLEHEDEEATKAIPIVGKMTSHDPDQTIVNTPKENRSLEETGAEEKQDKKNRKKWFFVPIIILTLFIVSAIVAFALLPNLLKVDEVEVPDVTELSYDEAEEQLIALNLIVKREDVPDETVPLDHVVRQNPRPGSMVKEQATVRLYVSSGKEQVKVENYVGLEIDRAESMLKSLDFNVERIERETDEQSPGVVLSQSPVEGEMVVAEETTIYLTYSVEPQIRLNNLEGETDERVRDYFNRVELRGRFQMQHHDQVEKGRVISQDPAPFTMLHKGDEVKVVISEGPKPEQEPVQPPAESEEEQTRLFEVNQPVEVKEEDREAGKTYTIRIVYRDFTTDGQERQFVDETINESKKYTIPLRVSRSQSGSFEVYVNDELAHKSKEYTYE